MRLPCLEDAAKAHKKALQLKPDLVEAKLGQALVEQDRGNTAQAKQEVQDVLKRGEAAAAYYYLGNIFFQQKPPDYQGVEAAYRKAIELEPNNIEYKLSLSAAFVVQDKNKEALSEINQVIRIQPKYKIAYILLAFILLKQNKLDNAISASHTALNLDDEGQEFVDSYAYVTLGKALEMQGNTDAAIAEFKEAISIDPSNQLAHAFLGQALIIQGDKSRQVSKINEGIIELKLASELYRAFNYTDEADKIDNYIDKVINSLKN